MAAVMGDSRVLAQPSQANRCLSAGAVSAALRASRTRLCRGASAHAGSVAAASPASAKAWQRHPPKSMARSSQVRHGAGIQSSPRNARKPGPSDQMAASDRSRTFSQVSVVMARA